MESQLNKKADPKILLLLEKKFCIFLKE